MLIMLVGITLNIMETVDLQWNCLVILQGLYTGHLPEKGNSDSTISIEGTLSFLMESMTANRKIR